MSITSDFWKTMNQSGAKVSGGSNQKPSGGSSNKISGGSSDDSYIAPTTKKKKKKNISDEFWEAMGDDDIAPVSSVASRVQARANGGLAANAYRQGIDLAPVGTGSKKDKDEEDERKLFSKGAFEDGYDFGDIAKTILGTAGDVATGAVKGFTSGVEGIVDLGAYGVAGILDGAGNDDLADALRETTAKSQTDQIWGGLEETADKYSILGDKADAVIDPITQALGYIGMMYATAGVGAAAGVSGAGASALSTGAMFASSAGGSMGEAYQGGATDEEAFKHGVMKGAVDAGSELIFGGLGKAAKTLGLSRGLSSLDDIFAKKLSNKISNHFWKNAVEYGVKASAEGVEEVLAGLGSAVSKKLTYMSDKELSELVKDENLLEQFAVGTAASAIMQSGFVPGTTEGSVKEANKTGRDFITGLSKNEQAVVDKVYNDRVAEAEKNGKVSQREKNKIYDQVVSEMDKGYLSIDDIESALGGKTYEEYKSISEWEDGLQKEYDELHAMKRGEMTGEQIDREAHLKEQLKNVKATSSRDALKSKLSEDVFGLVKGDRLVESYNERTRRGQVFKADLTQYDAKQQGVIQKAIDSGILNNTNRTHEFVDIIAKISADKGVLFDFTNNTKLKESGFAVDGKQVNGFVTKDGITLNIDSPKAWQSTVGHEITHVLEGTELYTELQNTLIEYSKTKGEYDSRMKSLTELYKDVKDADVNAELTADLVGEYLFTDEDFVKNLSTEHRNVFQKIYDEIKYLVKVATGSKEARELEKVKRAFDKAYKEAGKTTEVKAENFYDSETKYSLRVTDKDTLDSLNNQETVTTYKTMQLVDGKLYPPMASRIEGKFEDYSELGAWEQATEHPELIKNGNKFKLDKGKGQGSIEAAYNPYMHSSNLVLNDQFSGAYKRNNLVTVECEVPVSELTSGYHAEFAKDSVGWHPWHTGTVAGQLRNAKGTERQVLLSRWIKPVRIVPDSEVAAMYKELLDGTNVEVPDNVVTPSLLNELKKAGVKIKESGRVKYSMSEEYSDMIDSDGEVLTVAQKNYFEKDGLKDDNGNLVKLYRSADGGRTVWNGRGAGSNAEGIYLTDDIYVARAFASDGKKVGDVLEVYAKAENPLVIDAQGSNYMDIPMPDNAPEWLEDSGDWEGRLNADKLPITAFANGHDAVIIKNVREGVGGEPATDVILSNSNQMKRTDNKNPSADPDIRYSLSDSNGKQLTKEQQEYFKDSKARDENGNLKAVYHGSPADFNTFSLEYLGTNGTAEGYGFYFTDKKSIAERYSNGHEGQQNQEGGKLFECYLDIKKPLSDTEVTMTRAQFKKFLTTLNSQTDSDGEPLDILSNYGDVAWEGLNNVLNYAMKIEYDGSDSDVNLVHSIINGCGNMKVVFDVLRKTTGYDGIIVNEATWGDDQTIYIAFHPEQIKNVDNPNPTKDPDIRKSLSAEGEQFGKTGQFATPATELRYEAPATEKTSAPESTVSKTETVAETHVTAADMQELFPDDAVPVQEELERLDAHKKQLYGAMETALEHGSAEEVGKLAEEYEEVNSRIKALEQEENERTGSLTDAPPEMDAPFYGESESVTVDNPFEERDWYKVGNQKVKAYMYENPEVKPFFQEEAMNLLGELKDTQKGERWYNDQVYYDSGGEKGWGGQKRLTSDSIETLLDGWEMSYADIEKGLNAIIEDNGAENIAAAKKIEFMLNDRLLNGYKDFYSNGRIEPNQDYINLLNEKQINSYSKEAFDSLMQNADMYAPEDVAPVKPLAKATPDTVDAPIFESKDKNAVKGQTTMFAPEKPKTSGRVANVLTEEAKVEKEKSGIGGKIISALVDKGAAVEKLSHETGNHELQAKYQAALPSTTEAKAQYFMENGADGVMSLKDIMKEVKATGKTKDFFNYLYHRHNVDRMSLEDRFGVENKPVYGDSITSEKSRETAGRLEKANPEFKAMAEDIYAYNKHLRKLLVDGNVISQETADLWEKMYPHYVPIRRVDDTGVNINVALDTNKTGVNAPVKRATGGSSDIQPLFETMAMRTEQTYRAIARNSFGLELKNTLGSVMESEVTENLADENGILPEGTIVKAHDRNNYGQIKSYNEATGKYSVYFKSPSGHTATVTLDAKAVSPVKQPKKSTAAGVDEMIDTIEMQDDLLKPGTMATNPTFTVFENGERVEFEITEDLYDALKPAGKILGHRSKAVTNVSEWRRNLLTTWNPVFALYRNPIKDIQDVAINSQHAVKTYANVPNAIYQIATGGKWATEYAKNGGKSNTYFDSRNNKFKAEDSVFKKTIGMPLKALEAAGEFIEEIPRLAEYIASRQEGRSVERSMLDSARVTTNFAAGGDFTKFLNSHGFTFLNASVQGVSQHVRNFREAKQQGLKGYVKVLAKYTVAGLPGILLNNLLWDDDEEYEELNDYVKQNYYVVAKTEDGKFIRIPKGRTAAVIQNAMEQMQHLVTGDDEADFGTFFELFMNNIAPNNPIENNIAAPIFQAWNNEAWYGGDLVPSRLQKLPAEEQFDESTDAISKWLGEKTGLSPYKINYLIDQYSGGVGDMILPKLTLEAESGDNSLMGNILAPWKKEITTDSVLNNRNPGDFYDLRDELEVKSNSKNATEEDKMRNMYMDSVSWEMSDLYAKKREIQNSDLPDDEKYEAVRGVQEEINEIAKNAMENHRHVQITGLYSEAGDKRYNLDAESGKWYEIKPKNADGSDNWYYQKEQEVTKGLGISYEEYWNNREEYNYAYDKPGKYALAQAVGGYDSYMEHYDVLENWQSDSYLKADKDSKGNSISGSRKEKVIDYINGLDADYGTKIILYRTVYSSKSDKKAYNQEIIDYLNERDDISYEQMKYILEELDMEVDSEGYITW